MNILRKYKISKINNTALTGIEKEIIDFINNRLYNLIPFKPTEESVVEFYMNQDGEFIFEVNYLAERILFRKDKFVDILFSKYELTQREILDLLKQFSESKFKDYNYHIILDNGWIEDMYKRYKINERFKKV